MILFFFVSQNSRAGLLVNFNEFLSGSNCTAKIQNLAKSWGSTNEWREDFNNKNEVLAVKTPTKKIGVWILLEKDPSTGLISATRLTPKTELKATWSKDSCDANLENIQVHTADPVSTNENLDDLLLQKMIDKKNDGLIYAFSPMMHLSVEGIPSMISLAKKLNLPLTFVLDPSSSSELKVWKSRIGIKSENILILHSRELTMRGMGVHYPSLIVYSKNRTFSGIYPGRQSEVAYTKYIQDFLK